MPSRLVPVMPVFGKIVCCMPTTACTKPWYIALHAGDRRLQDLAKVNLGVARSAWLLPGYKAMAWDNLPGLLSWKCKQSSL